MAKKLERRKPGYNKSGDVRIVSLNYKQCQDLIANTTKKKVQNKIRNRMQILEQRPGFVRPAAAEAEINE